MQIFSDHIPWTKCQTDKSRPKTRCESGKTHCHTLSKGFHRDSLGSLHRLSAIIAEQAFADLAAVKALPLFPYHFICNLHSDIYDTYSLNWLDFRDGSLIIQSSDRMSVASWYLSIFHRSCVARPSIHLWEVDSLLIQGMEIIKSVPAVKDLRPARAPSSIAVAAVLIGLNLQRAFFRSKHHSKTLPGTHELDIVTSSIVYEYDEIQRYPAINIARWRFSQKSYLSSEVPRETWLITCGRGCRFRRITVYLHTLTIVWSSCKSDIVAIPFAHLGYRLANTGLHFSIIDIV